MPAASPKTPYEVLGVPRTATQDEIKKRYRELARQYHPDVNQNNPAASQIFSQVTQAYKALSDPDSRKVLDAEMILKEKRAEQNAARYGPAAGASRPNGSGSSPRPGAPRPTGSAAGAAASANAESARLTVEARNVYHRDRMVEARTLALQALSFNKRNADAWEVLGDIYRRQGKTAEAENAYSNCIQINPRQPGVMERWERITRAARPDVSPQRKPYDTSNPGATRGPVPRPSVNRGYAGGGSAGAYQSSSGQGRASRMNDPEKRPIGLLLFGVIGYGAVFMTILYAAMYPGVAPTSGPVTALLNCVSTWNATITTVLALCGLILGATMTITGAIRRIDDELVLSGVTGQRGTFMPLGLLMIVISVLNFYLAAAIYAIVTAIQESFTPSMMRVFIAVTVVVLLVASTYAPGHLQVLLFGGNVVFITFVVGWLLGDFFRSDIG